MKVGSNGEISPNLVALKRNRSGLTMKENQRTLRQKEEDDIDKKVGYNAERIGGQKQILDSKKILFRHSIFHFSKFLSHILTVNAFAGSLQLLPRCQICHTLQRRKCHVAKSDKFLRFYQLDDKDISDAEKSNNANKDFSKTVRERERERERAQRDNIGHVLEDDCHKLRSCFQIQINERPGAKFHCL